jgi:hypothetical protein
MKNMPGGNCCYQELVEYFLRMYKNRPAMIDELHNINT